MSVYFEYEADTGENRAYEKLLTTVIEMAVQEEECPYEIQVNVLFTDNENIHAINRQERGIDRPTDVLSFPMAEYEKPGDFSHMEEDLTLFEPDSGELLLGDIVISCEKAKEQAAAYGHSYQRELSFLVAHSMLHLMGYDHMEDEERACMEKKQEQILEKCGIARDFVFDRETEMR